MFTQRYPGFHTNLTPEVFDQVMEAIPKVIVTSQVAALVRIPRTTMIGWIKQGEIDAENKKETYFAQFSTAFKNKQAEVVLELLEKLRNQPRNYQPLTWMLERCFRKDFGADASQLEELKEIFEFFKSKNAETTKGKEPNHENEQQSN